MMGFFNILRLLGMGLRCREEGVGSSITGS